MPSSTLLEVALRAVSASVRAIALVTEHPLGRVPCIKPDGSPVTAGDVAAQAAAAIVLRRELGLVGMVGEETPTSLEGPDAEAMRALASKAVVGAIGGFDGDPLEALAWKSRADAREGFWTLDPIDGTKGYRSSRHYAVCLAHVEARGVSHGVLGLPTLVADMNLACIGEPPGVLIAATRGEGSWLHDPATMAPIRRVQRSPMQGAIRLLNSVEPGGRTARAAAVVESLGRPWETIAVDSQLKYALVALGVGDCIIRVPGSVPRAEHGWDHAAGVLIATEAGAVASDADGRALDFTLGEDLTANEGIIVCDPSMHQALVEAVRAQRVAARA
jgi:3'(2'), 5'-bisphosphate nucleotidase